jgi:hypothetical protein
MNWRERAARWRLWLGIGPKRHASGGEITKPMPPQPGDLAVVFVNGVRHTQVITDPGGAVNPKDEPYDWREHGL